MGKNTKVMPQNPAIYLFLGKGRESFVSDFIKKQNLVHFLPCSPPPPACKYFSKFRHCVDDARQSSHKIDHKIPFLQISHLSSNRRVCNLTLYFQFTTHSMNFGYAMFLRYPEPEKTPKTYPQNSTNFSNTIILCYLEPAKRQKTNQKTRISYQTALIDPSHNAKESISFSQFCTSFKCIH